MGKNAKIGIAAGVIVVITLLCVLGGAVLIGLGVLVLGGLGVALLYQRLPDDEVEEAPQPKARDKNKSKLDHALEGRIGTTRPAKAAPPAAPPTEGLPTWSPTGFDTWTPPAEPEVVAEDPPTAKDGSSWDSWDDDWDSDTIVAEDEEEENPLAALDRLDEIDPIAEVERLDSIRDDERATPGKPSGFSFASAPPVIKEEEVKTADDIMAASEAMELHVDVDEGGDSELAKLLAKVQARLSAYE